MREGIADYLPTETAGLEEELNQSQARPTGHSGATRESRELRRKSSHYIMRVAVAAESPS